LLELFFIDEECLNSLSFSTFSSFSSLLGEGNGETLGDILGDMLGDRFVGDESGGVNNMASQLVKIKDKEDKDNNMCSMASELVRIKG
jgi:hypothetical protein